MAGIAVCAAALIFDGPVFLALLAMGSLSSGWSAYQEYFRARENDLAESAAVFGQGTVFTETVRLISEKCMFAL